MTASLPGPIASLIRDEQARSKDTFVRVVDLDAYLAKLAANAEVLSDAGDGRCRGFIAFYCNNRSSRQAFITLVLVDPRDRGTGLGRTLMAGALAIVKQRGFTSCRIEVAKTNEPAYRLYLSQGFQVIEDRADTYLLETGV